ncbi:phosphohydrolase [Ectothiorhodospira haloalkaliphila]|uniref:Phosphohydrolase n=1 Tax=Ectothiorhodospira haloalkaliphila TaxID=421628 RepID=W8KF01_9GAMM|nr:MULTISPECIES: cytochrome c biogenesis protein CcsA [Ectothiorhodospira]AHK78349.1 phosphohydrolase [Ectothiorhodospira haloalkaliphila]MCG5495819.1 cytochrome c biogenesis protein CcsA [Ectothiorhodospira variabilis]MCG5498710.1 cytochrome c biogenesis protein CcsA [Ectothiorhodospira variabilis]MCG5504747.1 cytochrome c biogenesis protein CcsA [Ectothiorhodospira variabilis]MCG5507904.1 cytochrome c biogenesis protein CcsA [Ectothiorhodospira variabilis]
MLVAAFGLLATVFYFMSGALLMQRLRRAAGGEPPSDKGRLLLFSAWGAAIVLHALVLYHFMFGANGFGIGVFSVVSMTAWIIAVFLFVWSLRHPIHVLGIILLPFAGVTVALEMALAGGAPTATVADPGLRAHMLLAMIAFSLLTIAAIQAGLLALQNYSLHNHRPGGLIRALPPLSMMDSMLFHIIGWGFIFLTAALGTGLFVLEDILAQQLAHKVVFALIAWVVFAILLFGRFRFGWRGRKAVRWTLMGFAWLVVAYVGTKLVMEVMLGIA